MADLTIKSKGGALGYEGAHALARRIVKYWKHRGHTVNVLVAPVHPLNPTCDMFQIRSDLINGLPRG